MPLTGTRAGWLTSLVTGMLALIPLASSASADPHSLYSGPGPRPGPDVLYAPLADAPQLDNAPQSVWRAAPILVSGSSAYRGGEFLYQDFLYDDHGARGATRDPNDPRQHPGGQSTSSDLYGAPNGTYTYPTNPAYAGNAADLVELRVRPLADATAIRLTLNSLTDPGLVAATIALGGTPGVPVPWPHGANVSGPGQLFLTWHGTGADLLDAAGNPVAGPAPTVSVDPARRQVELRIPHAAWGPTGQAVRMAAGVGLWDAAGGRYLLPQVAADATHPGGAAGLAAPAAFFNVAFRFAEPMPTIGAQIVGDPAAWRDNAQGHALAAGDMSAFSATVDFRKLATGTNDDMPGGPQGVPQTGPMDRILASHSETEQGTDFSTACQSVSNCLGELRGRLQPYEIYIPHRAPPASGYGLVLLMHSLTETYNQYEGSRNESQFAERGTGSIVITPSGRGPDGFDYGYAGALDFETWADVAARYHLDSALTDVAGYSMGGYGTWKYATEYPDLFAKAQPTVGPPGLGVWVPPGDTVPRQSNTYYQLASLRNVPVLSWAAVDDDLVPFAGTQTQARGIDALGYRYEFDAFPTPPAGEPHTALAFNDQFAPAADFLGSDRVTRDPAHVTYVENPTMDVAALGVTSGHAYWVSGITLRDASGPAPQGTVDVRSEGFGVGDPTPSGTQIGSGTLPPGNLGTFAYNSQRQTWGPAPATPVADVLDIHTRNLRAITIDAARARVSCQARLHVSSDGPVAVRLVDCGGAAAGGCRPIRSVRIGLRRPRGARVVRAVVLVDGRRVRTVSARRRGSLRSVLIRLSARSRGRTVRVTVRERVIRAGRVRTLVIRHTYRPCARTRHRRARRRMHVHRRRTR